MTKIYNATYNLPWSFVSLPADYDAWVAAIDDAPEARGFVSVDEPEPEDSLWPEDTDEDGEVLTHDFDPTRA